MPVAAIAMAASSFVAGATSFAAAASLAAGAVMAGSAMTIVGTLTGNKKLSMIGAALTIGGGLAGGMANPFGGGEGAATEAAGGVDSLLGSAGVSDGAIGTAATPGMAGAEIASMEGMNTAAAAGTPLGTAAPEITAIAPGASGAGQQAVSQVAGSPAASPFQAPMQNAMSTPALSTNSAFQTPMDVGGTISGAVAEANKQAGLIGSGYGASTSQGGFFDKAGQWVRNNKELTKIGADAASGMLGSLVTSDKDQAEIDRLKLLNEQERLRMLWRQGKTA